jgi:protein-tyrosine phosphatase
MIDLHCHILPGVDDGPPSLEDALAMCRLAAADGCEAMVATPHQRREPWWNDDVERLRERGGLWELADELQERVRETLGNGFQVLLGGEVHADREILSEVERLAVGKTPGGTILSLAGSRYLLIELDRWGSMDEAVHLIHEITVAGWRPILAHPELIPWLDLDLLAHLVRLGATAQVTAMSVTGDFGRRPMQDSHRMIEAGLVHFLASDAHDTRRRPPGLRRAGLMIEGRWGDGLARRLTVDNPQAVVENRPLPAVGKEPEAC